MSKSELISCFQDTLQIANSEGLRDRTIQAQNSNRVYREGFIANVPKRNERSSIIVESGTTFATAKKYRSLGKTAVLNFANPENPGGGVHIGAMAQEECLCRSSNLWLCLSNSNVFDDYYFYHRTLNNSFYTDRLIYTRDVTVFKDDSNVPQIMPVEEWFDVDVITCAAPYIAKRKYTNSMALLLLFKSRIKNIFEAAKDNKVDVLILGAFGCGAFRNPPLIVAEAFRQVICEQDYFAFFKQIVFAIKPTKEHCPNLDAFSRRLDIHVFNAEERGFHARRQFSILGDSISTLEGYNPKGYKVFYSGDNCVKSGVNAMEDTWWGKVIGFFDGELLVNNSWSGSRVTKLPGNNELFPSGCSNERTSSLHINSLMPDVIIVYLGTNDWAFGAMLGCEPRVLADDDNEYFEFAYDNMLRELRNNYPQSEIWCCTLSETFISKCPDFQFPYKNGGTHIEEYNDIIRNVVRRNSCKLIDLYNYKMPYDSIDGSHPNEDGMNTLGKMMIRAINQTKYVGTVVGGRYSVLQMIGRGGFCTTYLVRDTKSNNIWAMKACDKTDKHYCPAIRENILHEVNMMIEMKHPAIPQVVDIVEDEEGLFIIREYVEGVTLESVVRDSGAVRAEVVAEWGKALCDMLGYLHKMTPPRIYRDMKPANIILTPDHVLKVIDFGIVRVYDPMKKEDTCFLGTKGYAAPEQYGVQQSDARTDIYGLGMTMHHLVTGIDPKKSLCEALPIRQYNAALPKGLEYIISKCIQRNPDERYQSCDELLDDLNNYEKLPKKKGILGKLFKTK